MSSSELLFPPGFLWGSATASHQVEGGNTNNDWWTWEEEGSHVRSGDRSGTACDWWHRAEEDFDYAQQLGHNSHRLSLEWSRLEPCPGQWDDAAFARYRQMLNALHARGIQPMVTLHHFTNPAWLAELGGWENEAVIAHYRRFVGTVMDRLGDLTSLWCTINEPVVYAYSSYLTGIWPPGVQDIKRAFRVVKHMLLAHGEAYRLIHALRGEAQVGLVQNMIVAEPQRPESWADRQLASFVDRIYNILPLQAVSDGRLRPPLGLGMVPKLIDSIDFIGINYYSRFLFGIDRHNPSASLNPKLAPDSPRSDFDYGEIYPQGMYQVLKQAQRFDKPIYITENGLPDHDDDQRPGFILSHLAQAWRAMQEGVPLRGYYHWSLLDNFEWAEGYAMRFGLIEVDFSTQIRRIRTSGRLYGEICQSNAITPELVERYAPDAMEDVFGAVEV